MRTRFTRSRRSRRRDPTRDTLFVAQIIPDTEAEGPGIRFAVWVQGCPMRCPGCCNPEMLQFKGGEEISASDLARQALSVPRLEGVSILGGEPFAQAEAVYHFASRVRSRGLGVMIYTGFTIEELGRMAQRDPFISKLLRTTDLLVDGRYDRGRPEPSRRWIGSTNQRLHFMTTRYDPRDPTFRGANTVEVRMRGGKLVVSGWPQHVQSLLPRRGK